MIHNCINCGNTWNSDNDKSFCSICFPDVPKNGEVEFRTRDLHIATPNEIYMSVYGHEIPKELVKEFRQFLDGSWTKWKVIPI